MLGRKRGNGGNRGNGPKIEKFYIFDQKILGTETDDFIYGENKTQSRYIINQVVEENKNTKKFIQSGKKAQN